MVHDGSMTHPNSLVQHTLVAIEDFSQANDVEEGVSFLPVMTSSMFRKAPSSGWKKMNWDASIAKDKDWMGFGMVLRDELGLVIVAYSKTFVGRLDVLKAEARAALTAIHFYKIWGLPKFIWREMHKG